MTDLAVTDRDPAKLKIDAVIIGTISNDDELAFAPGADSITTDALRDALVTAGATGAEGEVAKVATFGTLDVPVVIAVGLGDAAEEYDDDTVRKAAGAAILGIFHDDEARARVCDRLVDVTSFAPERTAA